MKRTKVVVGACLGAIGLLASRAALASGAAAGSPPGIPDPAKQWDHLWTEVLIDITVIGVVFGVAALYMMFKYRAKSPNDVGTAPKLTGSQAVAWALIPAAIFMADDFFLSAKGWTLWNVYRTVPKNAVEIKVTGRMWSWEWDYGDGVVITAAPNSDETLKVPTGRPVVLRMVGEDVLHSFFLPGYRVKEDVMPGRVTFIWFLPRQGIEVATCTEFCGTEHSNMNTKVEGVPEADFNAWLAKQKKQAQDTVAGEHKV